MMAIFHWVSIPAPTLVAPFAPLFLLVLSDPVSLIMAPGVVCWRASIFIKESVVTSASLVLTRAENRKVALQRLQKFVHNVTPGLSSLVVPEGIMLAVPTMSMVSVRVVINSVS